MKIKFTAILPYLLLTILISIPIFGHLDTLPFRIWDEARPAMNAYEMYKNHQYWVTHFEGKPEMWQTKPPLLIWLQVFFSHLLGFGELAIRLPSAIAGFLTCIVLMIFCVRYLGSFWYGFISVLVLVTSWGYIHIHVTRTGDYDALLILFTTTSCLLWFLYLEKGKNKLRTYAFGGNNYLLINRKDLSCGQI
ncbi:MAG: glycosyltransferase family 39 protein [Bacteroidia bacterium]|nr:glycosyltransferase family 39 protein [Bacteroidia bacterium]